MQKEIPAPVDYLETKPPARYFVEDGWISQSHRPLAQNFRPSAPGNRYWYGCLLGALGHEYVTEGCVLLDYGCGNAPLAVFLSGKLEKFEYFGLEPEGSPHIESAPQHANIHVGYVGSQIEQEAIARADAAVLGSVFTHLEWKDSCAILDKLDPITKTGAVAFSCFIADAESYASPDHYPYATVQTYHYAFITEGMIRDYAERNALRYEISRTFYSLGSRNGAEVVHRFVRLTGEAVYRV